MSPGDTLTLLAGGGTVYVYGPGPGTAELVAVQRMMLDVAFPGDDTDVFTIAAAAWDTERQDALRAEGVDIVDTRKGAA